MADRVILACTLIVAGVYLYATTQIPVLAIGDPLGPKVFPRLLGAALIIAASFLALEIWRDRDKTDREPAAPRFEGRIIGVLGAVVLWTGCYFYFFEDLGYILATTIYLLPLTAWFNRGRWVMNIASVLFFVFLTYYLFVKLEVRLPPGVLPL